LLAQGTMQLAEARDGKRLATTLAGIVSGLTGAERVGVWLRAGSADHRLELQGSWPLDAWASPSLHALERPGGASIECGWTGGDPRFADVAPEPVGALPTELQEAPRWLIPLVADGEQVGVVIALHALYPADLAPQTTMLRALARQAAHLVLAERERLRTAREDAEFLAIAAHDLKNVATAVKGYAQLLGRTLGPESTPRAERAVAVIVKQVDVLVDTLNTLVDVGRLRAGRLVLDARSVDLYDVFEAASAVLETDDEYVPPAVELPQQPIEGRWDRARLVRALTLLLGAAQQSTRGNQPIPVVVTLNGDWVEVLVGSPTSQAGWPGPTEWSGQANAGLHLARRLLEAQGGALGFRSCPEGGSSLVVRLPLAAPARAD
jgi:signal transduction histidine kinase